MRPLFRPFVCLLAAVVAAPAAAGGESTRVGDAPALSTRKVAEALDKLAAIPGMQTGSLGFHLATLEHPDKPLLERSARQSFIPASTLKVLTTGCALETLGPAHRFETVLFYDRPAGDVRIRGAGDPSLGRRGWDGLFDAWLAALHAAGIHEVGGRIVADESAWESNELADHWTWLDIGNYYAPVLTPLSFYDNEFRLKFRLGRRVGERAEFVGADPWPAGLRFVDEMRTGPAGSGDNGYLFGGPGTNVYTLRGTLPLGGESFEIRGALPDPARFCAEQFTDWLQRRDVPVHGNPATTRRLDAAAPGPAERVSPRPSPQRSSNRRPQPAAPPAPPSVVGPQAPVARHQSAPLVELLVPINHRSLNLDCECLLRVLGDGRAATGIERIRDWIAAQGLPLDGFRQFDGSGLSRLNMITPELLARATAAFCTGPHGAVFRSSLPIAGESGTLAKVAGGSRTHGRIRAKSGHVERVKCYTGIVESTTGRDLVFAIMINNHDGHSDAISDAVDGLFDALVAGGVTE
jgi:D-alanyl-D-alanine carboxypeptidase/D-alanyl-D-alanine-endopeptidase (penicillin-binding protein 4)